MGDIGPECVHYDVLAVSSQGDERRLEPVQPADAPGGSEQAPVNTADLAVVER